MEILNNREIAIALWLLAVSAYIFFSPKMIKVKTAFRGVLSAFFVRQITSVLCLVIAYMTAIVYGLSELNLWNFEQFKNTVFWCVSFGFMSLFKLEKIKHDKNFFKNSLIDNLKLLAALQFIVNVYTFPLWIEILLTPFLALMGGMLTISRTEEKYHQVKTLLEYCLLLFGAALIIYFFYMLTIKPDEFWKEKTAYDFFTPPLLTLCYLPFIFFMLIYSTYEQAFIRLKFSIHNRPYLYAAKFYASILFNIRLSLLDRWSHHVAKTNIESHSDLINTFKYIFKVQSSEKNPKEVQKEHGWSPYKAKNFLTHEGLTTGFYNQSLEGEWHSFSPMKELNDSIMPDNISYYIEGHEDVVKVLKIKVNVNDATNSPQLCKKLKAMAEALSAASVKLPLSEDMKNAISNCTPYSETIESKTISLIVNHWPDHKFNGFDIKFLISSISPS